MTKTIEQCAGKWIAIKGKKKIINCSSSVKTLLKKIPKKELPNITISKIPKKNCILL